MREEGAVKLEWGEAQFVYFLAGDFSPALLLGQRAASLALLCQLFLYHLHKTKTQLEVKLLFHKYNFHKPFSKQLLTKLYKEQAHGLAVRGEKIT